MTDWKGRSQGQVDRKKVTGLGIPTSSTCTQPLQQSTPRGDMSHSRACAFVDRDLVPPAWFPFDWDELLACNGVDCKEDSRPC